MVERAAQDYSRLLQSVSLDKEINPICMSIEDMLTRLEELESLLINVKCGTNVIMDEHTNGILSFATQFSGLKERIDKLEQFVEVASRNVDEVDKSLDIAEQELNVTDYSLKGLIFKPLIAKAMSGTPAGAVHSEEVVTASNLSANGDFQPIKIFKSDDYFDRAATQSNMD